jgi:hypothetical protein
LDANISTILQALIIGLTGSGGLVGIYTIWSNRQSKKEEFILAKEKLESEKLMLKNKLEQNYKNKLSLEFHPLFKTIDEIEYFFMRNFKLSDEGRTLIVRELCVNKLKTWKDVIKKYVLDAQACYLDCESSKYNECNKSENDLSQMLLDGLEAYNTIWDKNIVSDVYGKETYDLESLETMRVFLPIFREWHSSLEELVRIATHEIPNSGMNVDCIEDWWDVLSVYSYAFVQMKYDAVGAIRQLNGELTGRKFLGVIIGDDH